MHQKRPNLIFAYPIPENCHTKLRSKDFSSLKNNNSECFKKNVTLVNV
jgi:hypothetical protein